MKRNLIIGGALALVIAAAVGGGLLFMDSGKPAGSQGPEPRNRPHTVDEKAQVEQAYLRFWDAWAKANESLDTSVLRTGMSEPALSQAEGLIEELKAKKQPTKIIVEHNYQIFFPREGFASVEDTFLDRSVRIDPVTGAWRGPQANETIRNSYTLKKVKGKWTVVEIIGYRPSPPA